MSEDADQATLAEVEQKIDSLISPWRHHSDEKAHHTVSTLIDLKELLGMTDAEGNARMPWRRYDADGYEIDDDATGPEAGND